MELNSEILELLRSINAGVAQLSSNDQSNQPLGFCDPPMTRRIYCNTSKGSTMFFWRGDVQEPLIIPKDSIRCIVKSLTVEAGEYKNKPTFKLLIRVLSDAPYLLVMGLETFTCKTALLGLLQVDLTKPVQLSFRPGSTEANALFCDISQNGANFRHDRALTEIQEDEILEMIEEVKSRLPESGEEAIDEGDTKADSIERSAPKTYAAKKVIEKPQAAPSAAAAPIEADPIEVENVSGLIAEIGLEIERVGWSKKEGSSHLQLNYHKKTRAELTPDELAQFLGYLQSLETALPKPAAALAEIPY